MGIQLPAIEEAIIRITNILQKICVSTSTGLLSLCWMFERWNSVVLFFGDSGLCSPDVPEFATNFGAVRFMLVQCQSVPACDGTSSQGSWFTGVADKNKIKGISRSHLK